VDLGVGYPGMFRGVGRDLVLDWARNAEAAGFDSLSTGERMTYGNPDFLMTAAMMGAVTTRIRIMSTILILPVHTPGVIAKQVSTLDALTKGRFVLGAGMGARPQDYAGSDVDFAGRGQRMESHLVLLKESVANRDPKDTKALGPVPHTPGGARILVGPATGKAARRAAIVDGIATFTLAPDPALHTQLFESADEAWKERGRPGRPYFAAGLYFALGPRARDRSFDYLRDYYSYLSESELAEMFQGLETFGSAAVRDAFSRFEQAGVDELYLSPLIPELDQIDRLAEVVGL
jgi:alkanesulfonate monooxygenase SsuD/methylene tetrahydromethanopterin reductase-like flavin-dependent oxidoreductase (luciferase family)